MHPLFEKANALTGEIIAGAIEVHRTMGPGLLEPIYEWCLTIELGLRQLEVLTQKTVEVAYKRQIRRELLCFDVLVNGCVLVEGKAVEKILPIHKAQLLTYMRLLDVPVGILINFNVVKLADGLSRLILLGADTV